MSNFELHYKPGKENEDGDYLQRHPINGPAIDDEDGDILLCCNEVNKTPKDREERELIAKVQMIQILKEAEEHFKVNIPICTIPSYSYEALATFQLQDVDISKVRDIITLKSRTNTSQRNKLPVCT